MPLDASISQSSYYSMMIPILQGLHYFNFGSFEVGSVVTEDLSGRTTSTENLMKAWMNESVLRS